MVSFILYTSVRFLMHMIYATTYILLREESRSIVVV